MVSTPDQLAAKFYAMPAALQRGGIPAVTAAATMAVGVAHGFAAGSPVPVPKNQIKAKPGRIGRSGSAFAIVAPFGFGTLAERGSYKKPFGWTIKPRRSGIAQVRAKRDTPKRELARARASGRVKVMLGDVRNPKSGGDGPGFAVVGSVVHTPFDPHPYLAKTAKTIQGPATALVDRLQVQSALSSIFGF